MTATLTKKSQKEAEKQEALTELRKILKPGTTVYTVLRHVSASGMSRRIDLYVMRKGEPRYISGYAGRVLGIKRSKDHEGLVVSGCGMDMGFHLVYNLSHALFPKGFIPAKAKPPRHGRNGSKATDLDTDGGYALNQRWL